MAQQSGNLSQESYSLLSLDEEVDDDRTANTQYAPWPNMVSATTLVTSLLLDAHRPSSAAGTSSSSSSSAVTYAIQGGFSMQLRGGRRSTRDVDLVTSIKMKGVWDAVTGNLRIIIPDSRLVEGVLKVFVKTGQPWDACGEQHRIELDIIQAGFRGAPRVLDGKVERVGPFDLFGAPVYFLVLDLVSMMRIKVACCLSRGEGRDFEDVGFMIRSDVGAVRGAVERGDLDEEDLDVVLNHEKMGGERDREELLGILRSAGES